MMIQWLVELPWWMTMRVLGIGAFIMIAVGLSIGIFYSVPYLNPRTKKRVYDWHNFLTVGGSALAVAHSIIPIVDNYTPYTWGELLIPFSASHHPILSGLGTIAMYLLLMLILTTDLRNRIKRSVWLTLHLFAYPTLFIVLIHSFFIGTDSDEPYIQLVYIGAIAMLLISVLVRSLIGTNRELNA